MATGGSDLFPRLVGSLKRKLNDPTTAFSRSSSKKATKHSEDDSPRGSNGTTDPSSKVASVQNEALEDEDNREAGPALPPEDGEEDDDAAEDDEGGRFFGGGVTKEERNVIDFVNENEDGQPEEEINLTWLKRTALNFERKITKNTELRAKYENDPMKFVSSEADLDTEIKSLSILSEHPELYRDFVRSGCSDSLVSLLSHDNTDIAIAACEVIAELVDEDTGASSDDWSILVKSLLKADLVDLLTSNLARLDENNESDGAGVYHVLNVFENLLSDATNAVNIGTNTKLLEWLLRRVKQDDESSPNKVGQNRQYAAELLVILAQNHDKTASSLVDLGAVDILLQLVSVWRRRDPEKESDEEEFAENLFDCLAAICKISRGCEKFDEDEGIQLCLIMLKEGKFSKRGALRVLDHLLGTRQELPISDKLVEAGGLKSLFTIFKNKKTDHISLEHVLSILSSMLRYLTPDSPERIRTLAKFVENDFEKCKRLNDIWREHTKRMKAVQEEVDNEKRSMSKDEADANEDAWYLRRIDAGLFAFQTLNQVMAWLIAEDEGARRYFTHDTKDRFIPTSIRKTLQAQRDAIDIEAGSEATEMYDMLASLIQAL